MTTGRDAVGIGIVGVIAGAGVAAGANVIVGADVPIGDAAVAGTATGATEAGRGLAGSETG